MSQVYIRVSGYVQGVFFRAETRTFAQSLGLTGFVRNTNNDVEITAQGKKENLEKLIQWCRKGSPRAKVEKVEIRWEKPQETFSDFVIRAIG